MFKDLYEISNVNSFLKENEENSDEPKEYKIADDMNNLSIIKNPGTIFKSTRIIQKNITKDYFIIFLTNSRKG